MGKHKKRGQFPQNSQAPRPSASGGQPAGAKPVANPPADQAGRPDAAEPPVLSPASEAAGRDISARAVPKTYFFLFWGLVIITVAAAWALEVLMPNVRESVIERWIMLAFAGTLGALLFIYK